MKPYNRNYTTALIIVTAVVLLWLSTRTKPVPAPPPTAPRAAEPAPAPSKPSMPQEENRPAMRPDPGQRITVPATAAVGEAPAEHMLRGVIAANAEELKLSPEEVNRLVAETLEFQEIQTELITRFLQETRYDPASVTLHVPPYPAEGKLLRDMYHQRLKAAFPDGKFEQIQERIGGYLDESFRGFGIADQTFTLTRSTEKPGALEVGWEVRVPESQTPSGPNEGMSYPGSLGRALLTPQQIVSGEYRFLAPVVARHFPEISPKVP
jgi:hypothetical protein